MDEEITTGISASADSTKATIIVADADVETARTRFPGMFVVGFSETGDTPPTHWVSTGWFFNSELEALVNEQPFPFQVKFGDFSEEGIFMHRVVEEVEE